MGKPEMPSVEHGRQQAITEIVRSVASEQSALGCILAAEHGKLQAITDMPCVSVCELLEANRSVERMVSTITRLEMVLQSKLELFADCLCEPCKRPRDYDKD